MKNRTFTLQLSEHRLVICRLSPLDPIPRWVEGDAFFSVTRTRDELSIVCNEDRIPEDVEADRNWRVFRVKGPLVFSMTGVLTSLITPLSEAGIAIFAISTYDTDYLLVKNENFKRTMEILQQTCIIENPSAF